MARLRAPTSRGISGNVQASERHTAPPGGASHERPRRPRPAVWTSASRTSAVPGTGASRAASCVFVESTSPFDIQFSQPRSDVPCERGPDAVRLQRFGRDTETVAAVTDRLHRHAEIPQRARRLPHGTAGHTETARQFFTRVELAIGELAEDALGKRCGNLAHDRPAAKQPHLARTRLGARPHARDVRAMRVDDEHGGQRTESDQRRTRFELTEVDDDRQDRGRRHGRQPDVTRRHDHGEPGGDDRQDQQWLTARGSRRRARRRPCHRGSRTTRGTRAQDDRKAAGRGNPRLQFRCSASARAATGAQCRARR